MQEQVTGYGIYLAYIDDYLQQLGEDSEALFRAAGIEDVAGIRQGHRVPVDILARVFGRVFRHPRLEGFFLGLGERIPITAHGNLGLAFMASKDIRTVLGMLERYAAIALPSVCISTREQEGEVVVDILVSTLYPDFNTALAEALVINIIRNISVLSSREVAPRAVSFMQRLPSYADRYQQHVQGEITFGATGNRIFYPASVLDLPVWTANDLNQRLMVQQCDEELQQVLVHTRLADRVRGMMSLHLEADPSIGFVAGKLAMSERTLRRRLREEGVGFRDLLKEVRQEMALYFLRETNIRIEQIAIQLGYRDTACFRQAFREATGLSPREWRKTLGQGAPGGE